MDTKRLQQLAGIRQLYEYHVTSEHDDDITYDGFTLKQEKEYEDDSWTIWHAVYKGKKYLTMLDHNPREWIDEPTFRKYVDFYKARGRWSDRQDFEGTYGTNKKVQELTEGTREEEHQIAHYEEEKVWFGDAIKSLQQVIEFTRREYKNHKQKDNLDKADQYATIAEQSKELVDLLDEHLRLEDPYNNR